MKETISEKLTGVRAKLKSSSFKSEFPLEDRKLKF